MKLNRYVKGSRGMTLLEIAVSVAIISAVILTTVTVMKISAEHMSFQQIVVDQQAHTRAALDKMIAELRCMDGNVLDFDTAVTASTDPKAKNDTFTQSFLKDSSNNYVANAVRFNIPSFNYTTNALDAGTVNNAITYRWVATATSGQIQRFVGDFNTQSNMTNVVLDGVPAGGMQIVKRGRDLAIRIGQENETPVNTSNGTKITTFITQITYCLRNH